MFYKIRGVSKKTGMGTVYAVVRVVVNGVKRETERSTGVSVKPGHFNTKAGKVTMKDPLHVEKNATLQTQGADIEAVARELVWAGVAPTRASVEEGLRERAEVPAHYASIKAARVSIVEDEHARLLLDVEELEAKLKEARAKLASVEIYLNKRPKPLLFSNLIDAYKDMKANEETVKAGTLKNFTVLRNMVARFNPQLLLTDMDLQFFQDWQAHLVRRGVTNPSILEVTGKLKTVFKHYARRHGIATDFLADFKPVKADVYNDVLSLTPEEIAELEALDIPAKNVGQIDVRRQFLFAIETGLRRSDYNVTADNFMGDELQLPTTKGSKVVSIPVSPKAAALFAASGGNFRLILEAQFNQTLRAICKKMPSMQRNTTVYTKVGTAVKEKVSPRWKLMSSHVARKTFGTVALSRGVSNLAVAEWLGHTTTAMIDKHYANKTELARKEAHKMKATS